MTEHSSVNPVLVEAFLMKARQAHYISPLLPARQPIMR